MLFHYLIIVIAQKLAKIQHFEVWWKMKNKNFRIFDFQNFWKNFKNWIFMKVHRNSNAFKCFHLCEFWRYEYIVNTKKIQFFILYPLARAKKISDSKTSIKIDTFWLLDRCHISKTHRDSECWSLTKKENSRFSNFKLRF